MIDHDFTSEVVGTGIGGGLKISDGEVESSKFFFLHEYDKVVYIFLYCIEYIIIISVISRIRNVKVKMLKT
jgi:hypothetical protein